jgi:hypothetical protein
MASRSAAHWAQQSGAWSCAFGSIGAEVSASEDCRSKAWRTAEVAEKREVLPRRDTRTEGGVTNG